MNNLLVALFPRINCRLLANEKTDGDHNVYAHAQNGFRGIITSLTVLKQTTQLTLKFSFSTSGLCLRTSFQGYYL